MNPVLQAQVKLPFSKLSLVQSALVSQGSDRQGSGSKAYKQCIGYTMVKLPQGSPFAALDITDSLEMLNIMLLGSA